MGWHKVSESKQVMGRHKVGNQLLLLYQPLLQLQELCRLAIFREKTNIGWWA